MLLKEFFHYAIFAISITATCARSNNLSSHNELEKRISKREDAIVVIDNFPGEAITSNKAKMPYKRISKHRYQSKPKRSRPRRKRRPAGLVGAPNNYKKKPYKNVIMKKVKPTYSVPSHNLRWWQGQSSPFQENMSKLSPWASSFRPSKNPPNPPLFPYERPGRKPHGYAALEEPTGFAEPPADSRPVKQLSAEVPVDSYGAPLKTIVRDVNAIGEPYDNFDTQDTVTAPDYININNQLLSDNGAAFLSKYHFYSSPSANEDEPNIEEYNLNGFSPAKLNDMSYRMRNKKHRFHTDMRKIMNESWKPPKSSKDKNIFLVGGQYAEPPARYVPVSQPNENYLFADDSERLNSNDVPQTESEYTATVSPYVNYKNSNLAFSPQNLNDAFSIDK